MSRTNTLTRQQVQSRLESTPDNVIQSWSSYAPAALTATTWYRRVASSGTCASNTATAISITVLSNTATEAYWKGSADIDWSNASNWCTSPSSTVNVTIPSGTSFAPTISTNSAVSKNLTIDASAVLTMNTTYSLGVYGNWANSGTFTPASSTVYFTGAANQTLGTTGTQTFYNLTINNSGTSGSDNVTLSRPTAVTHVLTLTDGILNTDATNLLTLSSTSTSSTNGGNGGSFVSGPMTWSLTSGGTYVFPTGEAPTKWARVALSDLTGPTNFTAQYFKSPYTSVASSDLNSPLTDVSHREYWNISEVDASVDGAVTLYWESATYSNINSCGAAGDLVVAHFNGTKWDSQSNSGGVTGTCVGASAGTVKGAVQTSFSPETFGF